MKFKLNPALSLVICSSLWSTGGLLIKLVYYDAFAIAGVRSLIAFLFLCLCTKKLPDFVVYKKDRQIDVKGTLYLIAGGVFYALTMILFVVANKMTTSANAILLQYTSLIYVIVLGPFILNEKNILIDYIAVAGIIAGMFILMGGDIGGGSIIGNLVALGSGIAYGLTTIMLRFQKNSDPIESLNLSNLISVVLCIPFILKAGIPAPLSCTGLILLGVIQIGLPCIFWSYGIKRVKAANCVVLTMCEPVLNPVWVALILKEIPSVSTVTGGCVILSFIIAHVIIKNRYEGIDSCQKTAV